MMISHLTVLNEDGIYKNNDLGYCEIIAHMIKSNIALPTIYMFADPERNWNPTILPNRVIGTAEKLIAEATTRMEGRQIWQRGLYIERIEYEEAKIIWNLYETI